MIDPAKQAATIYAQIKTGELIEASERLSEWLTHAPDHPDALTAQAQLLRLCGRYQEAQSCIDHALAVAPLHGPAFVEAARLAALAGALDRALEAFARARSAMPGEADWLSEWTSLAHSMQRSDIGVAVATDWCELAPDSANAWFMLGLVQQQAGALDGAFQAYDRAMSIDSSLPMLRNNLAALQYTRGKYDAALTHALHEIRATPTHHHAWTNVANAYLKLCEPVKALVAARRAATLAPDFGLAQLALSNAARENQSWDEAYDAIVRAHSVAGTDPRIQFSVSMLQLMLGDFRNGWANFEARWSGSPELERLAEFCPQQRWRGQALEGKTLLVWGEQGYGDAIQFIRFVPSLVEHARQAGGKVVCCCFAPLYTLFKRSLATYDVEVLSSDAPELPHFDYHVPLGSVPLALGVTLESLPAPASYLSADPARVARWQAERNRSTALKVGLIWSGSVTHQRNPLRAISPERYARAFSHIAGVDWYSLQIGAAQDVARMAEAGLSVIDRTEELNDFDDTAALIRSLDLVITVCTSVAHLAAALGRPTWLLLDVNPHWVWMTERCDSPWYPTIKLYRQRAFCDWSVPLEALSADLAAAAARAISATPAADPMLAISLSPVLDSATPE